MSNINSSFDYPIIWVFTKWYPEETPNGSILRNNHFLLAHCGFFFFNFINVCCILLFHGFVLHRLSHNFLMKIALFACSWQMASCLCSIHRYNINDEYGEWAFTSIWTGLIAYLFFNYVTLHLLLNRNHKGFIGYKPFGNDTDTDTDTDKSKIGIGYTTIGMTVWFGLALACWYVGKAKWDTQDFKFFRDFISLSTGFQLLSYMSLLWALWKGKIALPEGSPISDAVATRVLIAAIGLLALAIGCAFSGCPIFQYPATGMTFSVMVVVVSVVGEMDFMVDEAAPAAAVENAPADDDVKKTLQVV
jgi:hypothetical protein